MKGKAPAPEDSSSGSESAVSEEDSDNIVVDVEAPPAPEVPPAADTQAAKPSSFFFTEEQLGLLDLHISPTSRAKCAICAQEIIKGTLRGGWAFHTRKPNRYIHGSCIPRLDGERARKARIVVENKLANADPFEAPLLVGLFEVLSRQGVLVYCYATYVTYVLLGFMC